MDARLVRQFDHFIERAIVRSSLTKTLDKRREARAQRSIPLSELRIARAGSFEQARGMSEPRLRRGQLLPFRCTCAQRGKLRMLRFKLFALR